MILDTDLELLLDMKVAQLTALATKLKMLREHKIAFVDRMRTLDRAGAEPLMKQLYAEAV